MSYDGDFCACDYDAPSVYRARNIKAVRKPFRCYECGTRIKIGEPCRYIFGIWENDAHSFRTCALCIELEQWAKISVPCFCFGYGELHDQVKDMVDAVREKVPGFFFEYGRRAVKIRQRKRAVQ